MIGTGTIQWRCGVCNAAKPVGSGGICPRCRLFVCSRHLNPVLSGEQRLRICDRCLTPEDRVVKGVRGMLGKWFG